jgi:hypothetical protein
VITISSQALSQSGGPYVIQKSVIDGGGVTNSSAGTFSLGGTTGQPIAGQKAANGAFSVHAGFWMPDEIIPTAEHVVVSGRVMRESGGGVSNIRITMTMPDGTLRSTLTNTFGYFHFDGVELGQTYVFTATSKKYTFQQTMLVRGFVEEADDLIFIVLN